MKSLKKWQELLTTDRESIYFSDKIGRKGVFGLSVNMAFLSNRRLVFVEQGPFSVSIQSTFIREIRGMRLFQRRRHWIGISGIVLISIGIYSGVASMPEWAKIPTVLGFEPGQFLPAAGAILLLAFGLQVDRRLTIDVNGLPRPLTMNWQGNYESFLQFDNDLTYQRSLWEDAESD